MYSSSCKLKATFFDCLFNFLFPSLVSRSAFNHKANVSTHFLAIFSFRGKIKKQHSHEAYEDLFFHSETALKLFILSPSGPLRLTHIGN